MTGEKLLLFSSTPSIPFFSFCFLTSSSFSAPSILFSLCFPFSLLFCICISSSVSWLSMPANFSNATAILQTSFFNLCNSLNSSNFLKTSIFYSTSICCFVFLTLDHWTASALAFTCALSALKGLQAALALVQGAHEVA